MRSLLLNTKADDNLITGYVTNKSRNWMRKIFAMCASHSQVVKKKQFQSRHLSFFEIFSKIFLNYGGNKNKATVDEIVMVGLMIGIFIFVMDLG